LAGQSVRGARPECDAIAIPAAIETNRAAHLHSRTFRSGVRRMPSSPLLPSRARARG
jgi:hypothetical protein